jgi:hypothetical protein
VQIPRSDPGDCRICGAAYCSCGTDGVIVQQLRATADPDPCAPAAGVPTVADTVQATLPAGQFTTGTYRGRRKASS